MSHSLADTGAASVHHLQPGLMPQVHTDVAMHKATCKGTRHQRGSRAEAGDRWFCTQSALPKSGFWLFATLSFLLQSLMLCPGLRICIRLHCEFEDYPSMSPTSTQDLTGL